MSEPQIVKSHDVQLDADYVQWLGEIKDRYRSAQVKAAVRVNAEQLLFNWQLGRDLVQKKAEERWGSGVVEQVSLDLQAAFPESKGFSVSNLWRMKQWYLFYSEAAEKLAQAVRELQIIDKQIDTKLAQPVRELSSKKLQQAVGEISDLMDSGLPGMDFPSLFALVPWGHHIEIIAKCKTVEEALFYVSNTADQNWSRATLMNCIKSNLYHTSGGAVTNFADRLSSPPFQPEFAGKLNFYVNAVDDLIKTEVQNPTIGLLICSNKDETEVQYAFRGVQTPMGVASYNNVQIREIQEKLPSVEELKKRIRLLEMELADRKSTSSQL